MSLFMGESNRPPLRAARGLRRSGTAGRNADRLAEIFEVSVRTIKRDISTLQHGGFPVWARPGPGGGYIVDAAATLPPVNFTDAEASGLAAAIAAHRGQPFDSHARAALTKILSVMDAATRERSDDLGSRIWIDHTDAPGDARIRRAVEQALHQRRVLSIRYRDEDGRRLLAGSTPSFSPTPREGGISSRTAAPATPSAGSASTASPRRTRPLSPLPTSPWRASAHPTDRQNHHERRLTA